MNNTLYLHWIPTPETPIEKDTTLKLCWVKLNNHYDGSFLALGYFDGNYWHLSTPDRSCMLIEKEKNKVLAWCNIPNLPYEIIEQDDRWKDVPTEWIEVPDEWFESGYIREAKAVWKEEKEEKEGEM